jgi:hypothetical protein
MGKLVEIPAPSEPEPATGGILPNKPTVPVRPAANVFDR